MGLEQYHVELLQAFFLQISLEDFRSFEPISSDKVEPLVELIKKITIFKQFLRITEIDTNNSKEDIKKQIILDSIRLNTEVVRNWAYPEQTFKTLRGVYSPLCDEILKGKRVNIITLIFQLMCLLRIFGR